MFQRPYRSTQDRPPPSCHPSPVWGYVPALSRGRGSPAPRGRLPFPGAPARLLPHARAQPRSGLGGRPGAPFVLFAAEGPRTERCRCELSLRPGRGAAGPAQPLAALWGLSGPAPPAAAASIINGGSGDQRLPPRETLPGAAGASLPAPRERWMRRRFPVTAMPGGGAGGAAAVPPLPLLQ